MGGRRITSGVRWRGGLFRPAHRRAVHAGQKTAKKIVKEDCNLIPFPASTQRRRPTPEITGSGSGLIGKRMGPRRRDAPRETLSVPALHVGRTPVKVCNLNIIV